MSEMSLCVQIKALDEMIMYIERTLPADIERFSEEVNSTMNSFLQKGGPIEVYQKVMTDYLRNELKPRLEALQEKLIRCDLEYLQEVRDHLDSIQSR